MAKARPRKIAHGSGVVAFIRALILEGHTNEYILPRLEKKFPESKAGLAGIGWVRNRLRHDGEKVKTNRELKAAKPAKTKKKVDLAA